MNSQRGPWNDETLAANGRTVAENFSIWFGKSFVATRNGKPQVVYHGTGSDIEAFDTEQIGSSYRADKRGFFFVSDPQLANYYAQTDSIGNPRRCGGNVIPAYVSLKKPLVVDKPFLAAEGKGPIGVDEDVVSFWDNYQRLILDWVDERHSDGVILVDDAQLRAGQEPTKLVVAFSAEQVKSAVGNCGLFKKGSASLTDHDALHQALRARRARDAVLAKLQLQVAP